ncbi:MAG: type II toxin-antitoxin system RelB/DinJ family antitoxin, partial [Peptococcales bacterium]
MKTIEIIVNEEILKEVEKVFHSIGMDVQMGVNIFLRRVAMEKGLPMSMSAPTTGSNEKDNSFKSQDLLLEESIPKSRTTSKITQDMVDGVWQAFLKYYKGIEETSSLIDEVSENSGMNRGSASIYMYV